MRLKKIKLAGFKSFVDPTTVYFPGALVGVLGPNGCGKSNIIDAVRWVMGESSAKNLRGDSMVDVIFNGSRDRKPLSQAFVELVFDNDEGRLLGEYAAYSEIAIKRLVTRDAQSTYFLNGTVCRRKDVVDIFLGTGLGPRSYSIIGQGTISRIIEAKPDELRVFLEEAAGISKYKERRRETQNRIKHTNENLARVNDIRDELSKQLERLQRQSKAAEKFKLLKGDERLYKAQLQGLRWNVIHHQIESLDKSIDEYRVRIEEEKAKESRLDANLVKKRDEFESANESHNTTNAMVYRIGAEIARLEEAINHKKERKQKLEFDLQQAKSDWKETASHFEEYVIKINETTRDLETLSPELDEMKYSLTTKRADFEAAEKAKDVDRERWDEFNQSAAESSKEAHGEQTRIQQLEARMQSIQTRIEKLQGEKGTHVVEPIEEDIIALNAKVDELEKAHIEHNETVQALVQKERFSKETSQDKEHALFEAREALQTLNASHASLLALQEVALGRRDGNQVEWLNQHQLDAAERLGQTLHVDSEWEKAVEVVLGDRLQALCLDGIEGIVSELSQIEKGTYTFMNKQTPLMASVTVDKPALFDKVKSSLPMAKNSLTGIYCAPDVETAQSWLADIAPSESIVTKDGMLFGNGWCRVMKAKDESQGILAREKAIAACEKQINEQEMLCHEMQDTVTTLHETLQDIDSEKASGQDALNHTTNQLFEIKSKRSIKESSLTQMKKRVIRITEEIAEECKAYDDCGNDLTRAKSNWQKAMVAMEADSLTRDGLIESRKAIETSLDNAKVSLSSAQDTMHEKELIIKTKQSELHLAQDACVREKRLSMSLKERIETLLAEQEAVEADNAEPLEEQLKEKLNDHLMAERSLLDAKKQLEDIKAALSQFEKDREATQTGVIEETNKLDALRLDKQGLLVRGQTIQETLVEQDYALKEVLEALPSDATETRWEEELSRIATRISRLGAINLAAIDEYEVESERKRYLDDQCNDLTEALETLEAAMNKIDKETKTRFKDTFDEVNERFGVLFPRLFGGGQACLELTGDDLLVSGVTVMARPPGKRNSTIHLLSGGEKAMSAVALVFAIFQLNPSPFCMLDEVDAPLDDSNVGRFCAMVKEMSEKVQFILITHNKVTMELADHLLGVTMQEPGVSRMVSVDVEKAVAIAN